ncbi:UvrD-helicase domain-containing protein [Ferrimonas aestuarii]|uniref:DNA 3'-5' helicase n=1 Tax=Ferrimonas aestuarii TaxID=2569539 RepID=A0A4U1BRL6_9GAMM|nr:UvrD-helicase domain-containing protein [Ferrimonas aestuarii]TKB57420.1 hypothetical protein FCL42_03865 [Ferrimonas aestuarii]
MSILQRRFWGRLFALSNLPVTASESGLQVNRDDPIPWHTLFGPIQLDNGMLFSTVNLTSADKTQSLSWYAKADAKAFVERCYQFWLDDKQQALPQQIQQIKGLLSQGYLSQSRWLVLKELVEQSYQGWPKDFDAQQLNPLAQKQFQFLQQMANADEHTLTRIREHYLQGQLSQYQDLFDEIEDHPLTKKQRIACVTSNDANLVLAGAGSGKTSTLVGRAAYLLKSGQCHPGQMLIMAFGKQAANEIGERLHNKLGNDAKGVNCSTFHSLGMAIITKVEGKLPKVSDLATKPRALTAWVGQHLTEHLKQPEYRRTLLRLIEQDPSLQPNKKAMEQYRKMKQLGLDSGGRIQFFKLQGSIKKTTKLLVELLPEFKQYRLALGPMQHQELRNLKPILVTLVEAYNRHLRQQDEIDFIDMIDKAHRYVRSGKFVSPWTHLLVDEFQDISRPRAHLIRALNRHADALFAVGDDWQSIYRFTGSDISLTTGFREFFGPTSQTNLDITFRYGDALNQISTAFVCKNPAQLPKQVKSFSQGDNPGVVLVDDSQPLDKIVVAVASRAKPGESIYLLARFGFQLPKGDQLAQLRAQHPTLSINSDTVHASKGKQADWVIVLGLSNGHHGFPSTKPSHPALEAMLPKQEHYAHAEERRLFYVALTRAKRQCFVVANSEQPSEFVRELHQLLTDKD